MTERENLTPKEIVAQLNKYIIGQDGAKKSVAVALRNRWRRKKLSAELQKEIIPKIFYSSGRPVSERRKLPDVWPT